MQRAILCTMFAAHEVRLCFDNSTHTMDILTPQNVRFNDPYHIYSNYNACIVRMCASVYQDSR